MAKLPALLDRLKSFQRDLIFSMAACDGLPSANLLRQVAELENVIAAVEAVAAEEAERARLARQPARSGKQVLLERYGGMIPGETPEGFKVRRAEIDRLEAAFRSGKFRGNDLERVQRRLCELKGEHFDDYEPPDND